MPELDPMHKADLEDLGKRRATRAQTFVRLREYTRGCGPLPAAIEAANVTKAYRLLMPMSDAPWGDIVASAVANRLEVIGVDTGDKATDDLLWDEWRRNWMDSESSLAHTATLTGGRSYATVWPDKDGKPEVILDSPESMIVKYRAGSRQARKAAFRHWVEDGYPYAALYYPDGIYKFRGPKDSMDNGAGGIAWEPFKPDEDSEWPVRNRWGIVPVVEIATNRELEPGCFPYARGEFENCTGIIDRANLLTFLGLVVAFWMGFPLRGVIGEAMRTEVLKDDDGNPIIGSDGKPEVTRVPPFDVHADSLFQLEDPQAKLAEFKAADRSNLSITAELEQLATASNTPRHYFPMGTGTSNVSSDTVVAWESGLHGKISTRHKPQIGAGWEDVFRLIALQKDGMDVPAKARVHWGEHESRSLAERADAASKLKDIMPQQALAEKVLGATADDLARWAAMGASDTFSQLIREANQPSGTQPAN